MNRSFFFLLFRFVPFVLVFVFVLLLFLPMFSLVCFFKTKSNRKLLEFLFGRLIIGLTLTLRLTSLICRWVLDGLLRHALLETHSNCFSQLRIINFHAPNISSSAATHENFSAEQFFAEVDFSRLDENTMTVILLRNSCNESLNFISLFRATVPEANQINCYSVFLQFLREYFQGIDIFYNGGGYEANYSLLMALVDSVL